MCWNLALILFFSLFMSFTLLEMAEQFLREKGRYFLIV